MKSWYLLLLCSALCGYERGFIGVLERSDPLYVQVRAVEAELGRTATLDELGAGGVASEELDRMALLWAASHNDFRMVCVWPHVPWSDEPIIHNYIYRHGRCFYHKKLVLNNEAPLKLLYRIPDKRPRYRKVLPKFFDISCNRHEMMCFLIQIDDIWDGRHLKSEVRQHYGIGQYSIHVSDTHDQSLDLAELFLNDRALETFNQSKFTEE